MCLIVFSYRQQPHRRLVLAANRDEFHDRPTAPMQFWDDAPGVLAGRDLRAGGTWFGITRGGRLAAITNYREPEARREDAPSRGALVDRFLRNQVSPHDYLDALADEADQYNGFNLLVGDAEALAYFSNRDGTVRELEPGLYGLSNHLLDTPWPKVERGKAGLRRLLGDGAFDPAEALHLLADTKQAPDEALPSTGMSLAWERRLSPMFIETDRYGTRSSTVLAWREDGEVTVLERTYEPEGEPETRRFDFQVAGD